MMNHHLEENRQDGDDERRIRERQRATSVAIGQLEQRDIHVRDDADPAAVAELLESVELFEAAVAARGGDSMVNTLDSSRPDRPRFVVPARQADEGIRRYSSRIRQAAEALRGL
jgi:hypothetical protein